MKANDYLKTRYGLKAMLILFPTLTVVDAVNSIPEVSLRAAGMQNSVTLNDDPEVWDTLLDMYTGCF